MKCFLYAQGAPVGWADLRPTDPSMGVVAGEFFPNENYVRIQPAIREVNLYDGTLGEHDSARLIDAQTAIGSLDLYVVTDTGLRLEPAGPLWLTDFSMEIDAPNMELNVCGLAWQVLDALFGHTSGP